MYERMTEIYASREMQVLREQANKINNSLSRVGLNGPHGVDQLVGFLLQAIPAVPDCHFGKEWHGAHFLKSTDLESGICPGWPVVKKDGMNDYPCGCGRTDSLSDALGHDALGHRTTYALNKAGIWTLEQLKNTTCSELRDLPGIGEASYDLIHIRVDH